MKYGSAGEITSEIMSTLYLAESEGSVRGFVDNILVGNLALNSLKLPTCVGRARLWNQHGLYLTQTFLTCLAYFSLASSSPPLSSSCQWSLLMGEILQLLWPPFGLSVRREKQAFHLTQVCSVQLGLTMDQVGTGCHWMTLMFEEVSLEPRNWDTLRS